MRDRLKELEHEATLLGERFLSLPEEIMMDVLENSAYATHRIPRLEESRDSYVKATAIAAIKFSHVCRLFRYLVARIPALWCAISNGMGFGMVSALCDRHLASCVSIWRGARSS